MTATVTSLENSDDMIQIRIEKSVDELITDSVHTDSNDKKQPPMYKYVNRYSPNIAKMLGTSSTQKIKNDDRNGGAGIGMND